MQPVSPSVTVLLNGPSKACPLAAVDGELDIKKLCMVVEPTYLSILASCLLPGVCLYYMFLQYEQCDLPHNQPCSVVIYFSGGGVGGEWEEL